MGMGAEGMHNEFNLALGRLIGYGLASGLIAPEDRIYTTNRILEVLEVHEFAGTVMDMDTGIAVTQFDLEGALEDLIDNAVSRGVIADTTGSRDLFDTKIMGCLTPPPSHVIGEFTRLYGGSSPRAATDYFYTLAKTSNYIRTQRCARDVRWDYESSYGTLEISINLAKPEKDPRDIAANIGSSSPYPECVLCMENEGYAGRPDAQARQNLRIIPVELGGKAWGLQYSPYVYYNEHCIVMSKDHRPMSISGDTFKNLLSFVDQFPHYFLGSNADLPIVGGSILSHEHYQGGNYIFPMERAGLSKEVDLSVSGVDGSKSVLGGIVDWPLSVIRLISENADALCMAAEHIRSQWQEYSDPAADVLAYTLSDDSKPVPHNTVTPIARQRDGIFELDIVLRNNRTSAEHPLGIFHPHTHLHHIKKENLGLIEVMGLAVLPARLQKELSAVASSLLSGADLRSSSETAHHAEWAYAIAEKRDLNAGNIHQVLRDEVGAVFEEVLDQCGVFGKTKEGREAFDRFLNSLGFAGR